MEFTFLGCGDAFGSGGRFNTCFHVSGSSGRFLIDCGASAMVSMRRFGVEPNDIRTIVLSHLHGDHFGGLPFFILDAQFYSKREMPLTIAGPLGTTARLMEALEAFFPGSSEAKRRFETEIVELQPGGKRKINNLSVSAYHVEYDCGAPPLALRITCENKILAYSGDTEWTDSLVSAGQNADLFVAEALFFDRKVRFHLDFATLSAHLDAITPKRLALTPYGSGYACQFGARARQHRPR
jgi:ribonuclease BN (tRNA processing enzyme)